jgi:hypothetical protein
MIRLVQKKDKSCKKNHEVLMWEEIYMSEWEEIHVSEWKEFLLCVGENPHV